MGRRVLATRFGTPPVLEVVRWEAPPPRADEVTIAVRAAAINPADHKILAAGDDTLREIATYRFGTGQEEDER